MFTEALFLIAKTWNQSKCPSTDERIKVWCTHTHIHTHTMKYYLAIKKNKISPLEATQMDSESIMLSEIIKKER